MGSMFKKPKSIKPPPPPSPPPTLQPEDEEGMSSFFRKLGRRGRKSTILAGSLEPASVGKRSLLG